MEYLVGAVVLGAVIWAIKVKGSVDGFNKLCLLSFPEWIKVYDSSGMPQRAGIARAFLFQTVHFAKTTGALSASDAHELEIGLKQEDPVRVLDEMLKTALDDVVAVCGAGNLGTVQARQVGLFMVIASARSRSGLRSYLQQFE